MTERYRLVPVTVLVVCSYDGRHIGFINNVINSIGCIGGLSGRQATGCSKDVAVVGNVKVR